MIESLHFPYWDDLLEKKILDNKAVGKLEKALAGGKEDDVEKVLVESKLVALEKLLAVKAAHYGVEAVNLRDVRLRHELVRLIPESMCRRYNLICTGRDAKMIHCVMNDPSDYFAREYVRMRTGYDVKPFAGYRPDILDSIGRVFSLPEMSAAADIGEAVAVPRPARVASPSKSLVSLPELVAIDKTKESERPRRVIKLDDEDTPGAELLESSYAEATSGYGEEVAAASGARSFEETAGEMEIITLIGARARELGADLDHQRLVKNIVELIKEIFGAEGASLILLHESESGGEPYLKFYNVAGEKAQVVESITLSLAEPSLAGWILLNRQPLIDNSVQSDPRHNRKVDELTGFVTRNLMGVPVILGKDVVGVVEVVNKRKGPFTEKDLAFLSILTSHVAMALHNAKIFARLKNFSLQAVEILIDCLDAFEPRFKGHMVRVARLATSLGEAMGFGRKEMEDLCYAAFLHDIGRIKCTPDTMEQHPLLGAAVLQQVQLFEGLIGKVMMHHERLDGSGYPRGVLGDAFTLDAQVLALAECFEDVVFDKGGTVDEEFLDEFCGAFGVKFSEELREPFVRVARELHLVAKPRSA